MVHKAWGVDCSLASPKQWTMPAPPTPDNSTNPPRHRIADLEVDVGKAEVTRGDKTIALPKLSFDLLCALIDAAPAIVSNEELLQRVWPGLLVSPESVAQRVKLLRSAIGDDSQQPRYILGVRGRGYRLIPVPERLSPSLPTSHHAVGDAMSSRGEDQTASTTSHAIDTRQPSGLLRRVGLAVAVLFAVGVIVMGLYYRFAGHRAGQPASATDRSIAVLPFVDMSEKKDQEYFADGMAEELIVTLARVPELRIPARTSSFYFKNRQATVFDVAKSLGVQYVLEGSVRKSGTTLRTTVELVRASNGYQLWSETYDRELVDVFKVQDEIAAAVVNALKVSLSSAPTPSLPRNVNPEAYSLYLQARFLERRDASGDYATAVAYLRKAIVIDRRFALAWAELALVDIVFFDTFTSVSVESIRQDAVEAAKTALTIDPRLPEAHLAMARIYSHIDWNWKDAERELNQVLQLDPINSDALLGLSKIAAADGRLDQALNLCHRVIERDPLNDGAYFSLATLEARQEDYALSEISRRKVLELNPTGATYHFWLGYALLAQGRNSESLEEMQKEDDVILRGNGTMLALDGLGRAKEAERVVAEQEKHSAEASANIAAFYACRKDADRAFVWLERAYVQRDYYITNISGDYCFKNLKSDARYKPFLRKMGLRE
jgi:TolB-like protein/DNA-binding winged helix-turn-helix (wHTH) protein/tetratricopeptide (TPR) repeat protein